MIEFLVEFWQFTKANKTLWLIPLLLVLGVVGCLLVFASGSVVAPFIYTLF